MMQVAGGMDRLPAALAARLGNRIVYRAAVREIRQTERGVWVIYADADGRSRRVDADYCVSHDPAARPERDPEGPVAARPGGHCRGDLRHRRPHRPAVQAPVLGTGRRDLRREVVDRPGDRTDCSTRRTASVETRGSLVGYYLDFARAMVKRPPAEIQRMALEQGARIHPQYSSEFESAFSVTWARVPWNRGSWRSESSAALQALAALQQPDGRVHFAGDYMTNLSSFMQGAFESARAVATAIHARALARA